MRATPIILSNQLRDSLPVWVNEDSNFKADFVFQQCLPEYFESYPLTAGMGFTETAHLEETGWIDKFNRMDKVVVATEQERINLLNSGVTQPIYVINMPMELRGGVESDSLRRYIGSRYCFYFVGEYVERKNIESLIMAYWREFKKEDGVVLLIKTGFGNFSPAQVKEYAERNLINLQNRMRLYRYDYYYPEVIFMTEKLSDEEMANLHATADCFVCPSRGESTCRPLIEAAFNNRKILCTGGISANDDRLDITSVESREVPANAAQPPLPYLYTGWETWREIDVIDLQMKMRASVGTHSTNKENVKNLYSYEKIANDIKGLLNG